MEPKRTTPTLTARTLSLGARAIPHVAWTAMAAVGFVDKGVRAAARPFRR